MAAWRAWRLRWKRRRFLLRALIKSRELTEISNRTEGLPKDAILAFVCIRNEATRLPHFLAYHRKLGVDHFIFVDNNSDDGSRELLETAEDVSLWSTAASYKKSRFGVDWLNHLLARYGKDHWCLTLDADELFYYENCDQHDLRALTKDLNAKGQAMLGALMLDLYPQGPIGTQSYTLGDDPLQVLSWFDAGNYRTRVQPFMQNLWVQGGPRARVFFADEPDKAPTLNKTPLVRWHWRYVYMNSTHALLPRRMNPISKTVGAVLLHTKFLPGVVERSQEEKARGEHFGTASQYAGYYDALSAGPDLWHDGAEQFQNWEQLKKLKL